MKDHVVAGDIYYGSAAHNYEDRRRVQPYWGAEDRYMRAVLETLPRGLSLLDVAMGTGRFFPFYADRNHDVTGIDSSADMLSEATRLRPDLASRARLEVALANRLPFGDSCFDLVVSFRFLSWIVSAATAEACLSEISRVAKRYVVLELCTNIRSPVSRQVNPDETLWDRLTIPDTCVLLRKHGLEVFSVSPIIDLPDHPGMCGFLCYKVDPVSGAPFA